MWAPAPMLCWMLTPPELALQLSVLHCVYSPLLIRIDELPGLFFPERFSETERFLCCQSLGVDVVVWALLRRHQYLMLTLESRHRPD